MSAGLDGLSGLDEGLRAHPVQRERIPVRSSFEVRRPLTQGERDPMLVDGEAHVESSRMSFSSSPSRRE